MLPLSLPQEVEPGCSIRHAEGMHPFEGADLTHVKGCDTANETAPLLPGCGPSTNS